MNNEINYLGVLATDDEIQSNGHGRFSVFVNQSDVVQFNIKIISKNPGKVPNTDYFVGYSARIQDITDTKECDEELRREHYTNELNKYLIGFTYKINYKGFPIIEKIMLKDKLSTYTPEKSYVSVPTYQNNSEIAGENFSYSSGIEGILERIKLNKSLGVIDGFVTDSETPPFIIWYDGEDKYIIGSFTGHEYTRNGFIFKFNKLKYIPFKDRWYDEIFDFAENKSITYVETETYNEIMLSIGSAKTYYEVEKDSNEIVSEEYLIEQFELIAKNDGLYYDRKDLINFHTAMKTGQLVILSGMSGTGKSGLVRCYAKALGLDDRFLVIPVRSSWNDDSDLFGFVDFMHMVYRPSDTGFIELLQKSGEEKNKMYIICLDEMNLARVEHYFSQLLSILEMPEESRILKLYDSEMENKLYNSSKYSKEIKIGENIKFVGTVNIDESTFHFSDKVLDRANVISLNVVPYNSWKPLEDEDKNKIKTKTVTSENYQSYILKKEIANTLTKREKKFLWEIHLLFNNVNKHLGIGPRVVKKIEAYVGNIPETSEFEREEAFDLQIVQRVLTKLRGPKEQLKGILGMDTNSAEKSFYTIVNDYNDISIFANTIEMLDVKKQELEIYGYTL